MKELQRIVTHEPFLKLIRRQPEADPPRLIYADWLEEQGDPRGEFIRLQCALAALPADDSRFSELQRRERELYQHHAAAWAKPLTGKAARCTFRRGFVEAVTLSGKTFIEHGATLFALAPIRRVHLTDLTSSVDGLAACTALSHVAELDLSGNDLGDAALEQIVRSPHLKKLRSLSLVFNGLTDRGLRALTIADLASLQTLDLSHNAIKDPAPLARASFARKVATLDLSYNEMPARALHRLIDPKAFPRLARLELAGNPIGDDGACIILTARRLGAILQARPTLDLSSCQLSSTAMTTLCECPGQQKIQTLVLDRNTIGDAGLLTLINASGFDQLTRLHLANNGITDAGARALADSALFPRLERLDLRENALGPAGRDALWACAARNEKLVLDLSHNVEPVPIVEVVDEELPIRLARE